MKIIMERVNGSKKKGFTLVELVCVVALLAILAAVIIPAYGNVQNAAAQRVADSNARTAYSIGRANDAIAAVSGESAAETEAMIEGGTYETDSRGNGIGRWSGEINGGVYSGEYSN